MVAQANNVCQIQDLRNISQHLASQGTAEPPGTLLNLGSLLDHTCTLIFLKMLKVEPDMAVLLAPLRFMSAQYVELAVQPQALCWLLLLSGRMGDESDELSALSHGALQLVMAH